MHLHIRLGKSAYVPGERVTCTVQVYNDATENVLSAKVQELQVTSTGVERTDKNWIRQLYRSDVLGEPTKEARKSVRILYKTEGHPLLNDIDIASGSAHQFHARFRLPTGLPPSFKGQSCRFAYSVEVKLIYQHYQQGVLMLTPHELTETVHFTVWPPPVVPATANQQLQPAASQPLRSMSSHQSQLPLQPSLPQPAASGSLPPVPHPEDPQPDRLAQPALPPPVRTSLGERSHRTSSSSSSVLEAASQRASQTPFAVQTPRTLPGTPAAGAAAVVDTGSWPPLIDYQLKQSVKIRWKEVPVDYGLLQGHLAGPGAPPLGSPVSRNGQQTPSPSLSTKSLASMSGAFHQHHHYDPNRPHLHRMFPTSRSFLSLPGGRFSGSGAALAAPGGSTGGMGLGGGAAAQPLASWRPTEAAALEQYKAMAKAAAAQRGQLLGRAGSSAALESGASSSSWSEGEGDGNDMTVWQAVWRRRQSGQSSAGGAAPRTRTQSVNTAPEWGIRISPPPVFGQTYSLQLRDHTVMKIVLMAPLEGPLQPGATFGGLIELRPDGLTVTPALVCHQLSVLLESEEVVPAEHCARGGGKKPGVMRKLHCEHQELTSDMAVTNFQFSMPAGATPSFETPMVALRWLLRFELTIGPPLPVLGLEDKQASAKGAPSYEQMLWSLPLYVQTPLVQ